MVFFRFGSILKDLIFIKLKKNSIFLFRNMKILFEKKNREMKVVRYHRINQEKKCRRRKKGREKKVVGDPS